MTGWRPTRTMVRAIGVPSTLPVGRVRAHGDGMTEQALATPQGVTDKALAADVSARISGILRPLGIDPGAFVCRVEHDFPRLHVVLEGPSVDERTAQALGVRVLDAVRCAGRTYGQVDVSVRGG
jgi:hypothetical protein